MKEVSYRTMCPLKKLRNKDKPSCNAHPWNPEPGLQIPFLTKKEPGFPWKKADPKPVAGNLQDEPGTYCCIRKVRKLSNTAQLN